MLPIISLDGEEALYGNSLLVSDFVRETPVVSGRPCHSDDIMTVGPEL